MNYGKRYKVAFLGGSFNPPHIAHIDICKHILAKNLVDQILVVPCFIHPFHKSLAPFEDRYTMCKLSMAQFGNKVVVSDIERRLGKVSTTIDTISALLKEHPKNTYFITIGSDILQETKKWKDFNRLISFAPLIVIPRCNYRFDQNELKETIKLDDTIKITDISSSKVRNMLSLGKNTKNNLHPAVKNFIYSKNLYGSNRLNFCN